MTAWLLCLLLAAQAGPLPVYLADGSVRYARDPAVIAFGRVVWHDVELDRIVQLPVSSVELERTRAVHEAARARLLAAHAPEATRGTVSYVGGGWGGWLRPGPAASEETMAATPCSACGSAAAEVQREEPARSAGTAYRLRPQQLAVEEAHARDAYAWAQGDYLRAERRVERAPTPGEALLRYRELVRAEERLAASADRLASATAARARR